MTITGVVTSLPYQATSNQIHAAQPPQQVQQVQGLSGQSQESTPDESDVALKAAAGNDVGRTVNITA